MSELNQSARAELALQIQFLRTRAAQTAKRPSLATIQEECKKFVDGILALQIALKRTLVSISRTCVLPNHLEIHRH